MTDRKEEPALPGWRVVLGTAVAVVVTSALALLLIPQLSLDATVRGGGIALVSIVVSRLVMGGYLRSRRRGAGE